MLATRAVLRRTVGSRTAHRFCTAAAAPAGPAPRSSSLRPALQRLSSLWLRHGLTHEASRALAQRAVDQGGVWADPEALQRRTAALGRLLPYANLSRLVEQSPEALECEPSALRSRLATLSEALPGQNVMQMVELCPTYARLPSPEPQPRGPPYCFGWWGQAAAAQRGRALLESAHARRVDPAERHGPDHRGEPGADGDRA